MTHFHFCLSIGAVFDIAMAPYRGEETGVNSLLQKIIDLLLPGEILLANRYYATFANIHRACREGCDVVMRGENASLGVQAWHAAFSSSSSLIC